MARKDRYLAYRDIIYYTAALIEIERNNPDGAKALLLRSVRASTTNTAQKSRSFLQLGDLAYDHKDYTEAKNFYDSVAVQMVPLQMQRFSPRGRLLSTKSFFIRLLSTGKTAFSV
jgi:Tfp pilus assembly protein PilF